MKRLLTIGRIAVQIAISGPLLALFPWAVVVGIGAVYLAFSGESPGFLKEVAYGLGWLGLLGLLGSIVTPVRLIQRKAWLRFAVTVLVACGFVATAALVVGFIADPPAATSPSQTLWVVWLLGGPVIVGVWNLMRIWTEPNQPAPAQRP